MHYIRVSVVEKLILSAIRRVSVYVRENESEFVQQVRETSTIQQEKTVKDYKKRLEQAQSGIIGSGCVSSGKSKEMKKHW